VQAISVANVEDDMAHQWMGYAVQKVMTPVIIACHIHPGEQHDSLPLSFLSHQKQGTVMWQPTTDEQ